MVPETKCDAPDNGAQPTIGVMATLTDYARLAPHLAPYGRTRMLDERGTIAAVTRGQLDLLIVAPRHDWWAEQAAMGAIEAAASVSRTAVLAMVPKGDAAALALAFDRGAADCIGYPFDPEEATIRARALLRRKAAADRRRVAAAEVRRLALTDPVTGLWNRHYLDTDLAAKIEQARTTGRPLALVMIDIDRFKPINDRHGHTVGDRVLHDVAARLGGGIRSADTLARFGGDELALVMPDTGLETAKSVAERLRGLVAGAVSASAFAVTVSMGVAELNPDEPAAALLARADAALYTAKVRGRNSVAAAS